MPKSPKKEPTSTPKSATKQGSRVLADLSNGQKDKREKSDDKDCLKVKPEAKATESSNSEVEAKVSEEKDKKKKLETEPTKTDINSEVNHNVF